MCAHPIGGGTYGSVKGWFSLSTLMWVFRGQTQIASVFASRAIWLALPRLHNYSNTLEILVRAGRVVTISTSSYPFPFPPSSTLNFFLPFLPFLLGRSV